VTGSNRSAVLPNVPTVAEPAYPNFEAVAFIGTLASGTTHKLIVNRINGDLQKILAKPDVEDKLAAQGFTAEWTKPLTMAAIAEVASQVGQDRGGSPRCSFRDCEGPIDLFRFHARCL
jgi:tripartite-type tricarboxylate transporter receptor subunit TctC